MPKAKDICQLRTPFEKGTAYAWQEYPRPQLRRSSYISLCGVVLTQLSDVEDEINGICTYDRQVVKPDTLQMRCISESLKTAFENTTKE